MENKKCFKCEKTKPVSEFYRHSQMKDGYLNKCKSCTKIDSNNRRSEKIEECREYDRKRSSLPHRKELRKKKKESLKESGRYNEVYSEYQKKYRKKYPKKYKARNLVRYYISKGYLKQKPCKVCGDVKSEAHHDDYDLPLEIVWLCDKHHKELHRENGSFRKNGQ